VEITWFSQVISKAVEMPSKLYKVFFLIPVPIRTVTLLPRPVPQQPDFQELDFPYARASILT